MIYIITYYKHTKIKKMEGERVSPIEVLVRVRVKLNITSSYTP